MALGPGKYDDVCTQVRESTEADGSILIIVNGTAGSGFSAQLSEQSLSKMPELLRGVADQIEADLVKKR